MYQKVLDRADQIQAKGVDVIHTEFHVTVYSRFGYVTEEIFPNREEAENFAKKQKGAKCEIDTMHVSDSMDRFQLKPLKKEDK